MGHPTDAIIIACVCGTVLSSLVVFFFRTQLRRLVYRISGRDSNPKTEKVPKSLQRALAELEQVTDHRGHRSENRQSLGLECPICLASLYCPETDADLERGLDLESGTELSTTASKVSSATNVSSLSSDACNYRKDKEGNAKSWMPQPIDDDVLKLKRCQHMYHARCLASWFLRKRYDCPVCRTPYYQQIEPAEESPYRRETNWEAEYRSAMPIMPFF